MQETVSRVSISQPSSTAAATASSNEDKEIELLMAPRCHLVSAQARSQLNSRRVTPTCGNTAAVAEGEKKGCGEVVDVVEKALANGDIYTGTLSGGVPHGKGKYLWSDGCMYEGEWKRGKSYGKGKFSWPSGATYEGDFKSGRMDGQGTFIGVDGESYKGRWVGDRKHGFGEKRYANGDVYWGGWRSNLQDGEGKYTWSNGNEYSGGWRNGVIHGKGVLIWANGNRYHGVWENGVPKGRGVFAPGPSCCSGGADSSYVSANNSDNGSNCNGCSSSGRDRIMKEDCFVPRKRLSVDTNLPKICIWELDGEAGDITCDIVDNVDASLFCKDIWVCNDDCGTEPGQSQKSPSCGSSADGDSAGGEVKKPGQMISKGHKNYDLMCNLQLGIRYSVGKHASIMQELRQSDFDPNEKFWTRFPPEGSKNTPPHQSGDFRWKDYCPMVFRHLRELFAIDAGDYMLAICGSDALREFSSPGKSGSFFYLTQDERFMIKTVKKSEVKVFTRMLLSYYQHVCQYNNSLITKFLGLHCVKPAGGPKMRFIVMGNLFSSQYRIHKRFDLKGSSHGRTTVKAEGEIDETTTLKDLDLNFVFRLERSWYQELIRQINRDCEFLEAEGIMDYSLLIGLHFCDSNFGDEMKMSPMYMHLDERNVHLNETSMRGYHLLPNMDWVMEGRGSLIRLGANMSARAECVSKTELDQFMGGGCSKSSRSQSGGEVFDVVLCLGIIDILQDYDISKKLEHAYKSLQVDPTSISAVDPKLYSKRFRDFIHRIFVEDR